MYILYKESNHSYPASVVPRFNLRGRVIAEVSDDNPINFIKGNVKVLDASAVDIGALFVGKWQDKYYILSDGQHSSSKETDDDEKVSLELPADVAEASLSLLKTILISNVEDEFDVRFKSLNADVPALENSTWETQKAEALAYAADDSDATPVLDILSTARGISVSDLVGKINTKVSTYNTQVAGILGAQQALVDVIKAIDNVKDLLEWDEDNFGTEMPYSLAIEKGISFSEGVNRTTPVVNGIKF
jgi:hypothetical protein